MGCIGRFSIVHRGARHMECGLMLEKLISENISENNGLRDKIEVKDGSAQLKCTMNSWAKTFLDGRVDKLWMKPYLWRL